MDTYLKTNREKRLSPKLGSYWCLSCDSQLVYVGQKCRLCGARLKTTLKKEVLS